MKKKTKALAVVLATVMALSSSITAFAVTYGGGNGTIEVDENGMKYKLADGTYATSEWVKIDGAITYSWFDENGYYDPTKEYEDPSLDLDESYFTIQPSDAHHNEGYDPLHPLAGVIDEWNLRVDESTINFIGSSTIHPVLTGQQETLEEITGLSAANRNKEQQILYYWFCNWLNSFDFENMSEMERALEIKKVLAQSSYDYDNENDKSEYWRTLYYVLIGKKGNCGEFATTAASLAKALGLKYRLDGGIDYGDWDYGGTHAVIYIQVDGNIYLCDNGFLDLETTFNHINMWDEPTLKID
ncbi:MAG: transglutaminase-like domain-containing protein [Clostridiales bacterium]|nr:transglutaminase-like domain-containing protein [Clostridiales bacterium]